MKKERIDLFWLIVKFSLLAVLAALIIRGFLLIPIQVEGNSMEDTLEQKDMIVMEKITDINRFDVVVFQLSSGATYVKRVIGLPGDALRYEDDQLYINDKKIAEPFLANQIKNMKGQGHLTNDFSLEELLSQQTLGPDEYFVMGDNRRLSKDSRSFGPITSTDIMGKGRAVYFPLNHFKLI